MRRRRLDRLSYIGAPSPTAKAMLMLMGVVASWGSNGGRTRYICCAVASASSSPVLAARARFKYGNAACLKAGLGYSIGESRESIRGQVGVGAIINALQFSHSMSHGSFMNVAKSFLLRICMVSTTTRLCSKALRHFIRQPWQRHGAIGWLGWRCAFCNGSADASGYYGIGPCRTRGTLVREGKVVDEREGATRFGD